MTVTLKYVYTFHIEKLGSTQWKTWTSLPHTHHFILCGIREQTIVCCVGINMLKIRCLLPKYVYVTRDISNCSWGYFWVPWLRSTSLNRFFLICFYCSVTQLCLTLCNPMDYSTQSSLSITNSQSLLKHMSLTISSSLVPFSSCLRSLVGCSPWGCKELDMTEQLNAQISSHTQAMFRNWKHSFSCDDNS